MTLSDLIYACDQRHYPMPKVNGVQVLRLLMQQHDLKQDQLPEIGRQSVVSQILAGKRSLTVDHIRNLSVRFGTSPAAFFWQVASFQPVTGPRCIRQQEASSMRWRMSSGR